MLIPSVRPRRLRRTRGDARPGRRAPRPRQRPGRTAVRPRGHRRARADPRRCPAWSSTRGRRCEHEVAALADLGVRAVILFGVPPRKDAIGTGAFDPDGIVQVALARPARRRRRRRRLMADLCVDEYTDHGHCGIVDDRRQRRQRRHARDLRAGRGRPGRRRCPRRRAERDDGRPGRGDPRRARRRRLHRRRRSWPTRRSTRAACTARSATPSTSRSSAAATARATSRTGATPARRCVEVELDIAEGADIVMVKPALAYLDVIAAACGRGRRAARGVSRQRRVRDDQGRRRATAGSTTTPSRSSTSPRSSGPAPTSCSRTSPAGSPSRRDGRIAP